MKNILSINGGAARGLVAIEILRFLEERSLLPLTSYYEILSGISVGAILSIALAATLTLDQCEELLKITMGHFKQSIGVKNLFYPTVSYAKVFAEVFPKTPFKLFGDLPKRVLVYCYDLEKRALVCLDNRKEKEANLSLESVMTRTAFLPSIAKQDQKEDLVIDAGIFTSHPYCLLLSELVQELRDTPFHLTAVCCGKPIFHSEDIDKMRKQSWLSLLMNGELSKESVRLDAAYQEYLLENLLMKHLLPHGKYELLNPWIHYTEQFSFEESLKEQVRKWLNPS